jgi:hypothetical protein
MTSATPCPICGRTLNGAVCCPDCGTPVADGGEAGPGALSTTGEWLPAVRGPEPKAMPLPELGTLPPERTPAPEAPRPDSAAAEFAARPSPRRRPLGKFALVGLLVAAVACTGAVAFSLGDSEQPESAPEPRQSQQTRPSEPGSPSATPPTDTPSPRVTDSDPLPSQPPETEAPAPAPPSPTGPPATTAPPSPGPDPRPTFSWPSDWPTPSPCDSGWCWDQNRRGQGNPYDDGN